MKNGANLRLVTPLNVKLEDLTVSDLFRPNSLDWDVELLGELFLPRDVKEICNLPPRGSNGIDKIVWHFDSLGRYTVMSGYRIATEVLTPNNHHFILGAWFRIWDVDVPHKVRILHGGLFVTSYHSE